MRLVYIHPNISLESHRFWYAEFQKQSRALMWIKQPAWNVRDIIKFRPDHIHFASRAAPRKDWMPISKIQELKRNLSRCIITQYRGGVGTELDYLRKVGKAIHASYSPADGYAGYKWMPVSSDPNFWNGNRSRSPRYEIIFIGRSYRGERAQRCNQLKQLFDYFPITIYGNNGWKEHGIIPKKATTSFEQNRRIYLDSKIGLNIVSRKYKNLKKYFSNRLVHMMQSGLPCLTYKQPELDTVFKDGEEIIFYTSWDDLREKIKHWLNPLYTEKLNQIGEAGKSRAALLCNPTENIQKIFKIGPQGKPKRSSVMRAI